MVVRPCIVHAKSHEVAQSLAELGLTMSVVRDSVDEGVRHVRSCTENDPGQLPGILGWGKITRAFRDRVLPLGWERRTQRNQPSTASAKLDLAIIVAGGTVDTGTDPGSPATRSTKGPATKDAIQKNVRSFSEYAEDFKRFDPPKPLGQTWVLLYYIDEDANEVRIELSLPEYIADDGHVSQWRRRIIIQPLSIQPPISLTDTEDDQDEGGYEAVVTPRV